MIYLKSTSASTATPLVSTTMLNKVNVYPGTQNHVPGIYLCAVYLMEMSKACNRATQAIMAILQDNTGLQQRLNKQLMATELLTVPKLYKESEDSPYKNNSEVQGIQTRNQQITALRQYLQGQQSSSQQRAQTNQKAVNSNISESMQILQTASGFLKTLEELTFKVNLTQPPKT